jgi:exonuclease, DNA polymerase III, epsilon subunit family
MNITFSFSPNEHIERKKGKSIIAFPNDFTVVDLETTGLNPEYDEIIEVCAVRVRNNEIAETFQTLVKPQCKVDDFISELTGITNEMLEDAPSPDSVISQLYSFIGNDIVIGHNVNFDINFLYDYIDSFLDKRFGNDYIDTMRIARKLFPDKRHHRLADVAEYLNISYDEHHRAMADCRLTLECYMRMHNMVLDTYPNEESFVRCFGNHRFDLTKISSDKTEFDETHPLYGKFCVFTGKLDKMTRTEAAQIVVNFGGICENTVTKKTNYLILGNTDYSKNIKDGKSAKQKKAEQYRLEGQDIVVIPESTFYDITLN